jgi:hypothetical protein
VILIAHQASSHICGLMQRDAFALRAFKFVLFIDHKSRALPNGLEMKSDF